MSESSHREGHLFISYSRADGEETALQLRDEFLAAEPSVRVWLDAFDIPAGALWDTAIERGIRDSRAVLFVMTDDSLNPESGCTSEIMTALAIGKPVVPLRMTADLTLPMQLAGRQVVDFSGGFESGLARLRLALRRLDAPADELGALRSRRDRARRDLARTDARQRARVAAELDELDRRIEEQELVVADPAAARSRTDERIESALERERRPPDASIHLRTRRVKPLPLTPPPWFRGRDREIGQIVDFLRTEGLRMLTIDGRGGIGKTALVCQVLKALVEGTEPAGGLRAVGVVCLSPVGAHTVTFANLFRDLSRLMSPEDEAAMEPEHRRLGAGPAMLALLEALPPGLAVVFLDNVEEWVDPRDGTIIDADLDAALRALLTAPEHSVKVIMTTRESPTALLQTEAGRQRRLPLTAGLGSPDAENVLRAMDSDGRLSLRDAPVELLARARRHTAGYPRALEALVGILQSDIGVTLAEVLDRPSDAAPDRIVEVLVAESVTRLDPSELRILQALSVFNAPVPSVAVDFVLRPYLPTIDSARALSRLYNKHFVFREERRYSMHPVDRAYIRGLIPEAVAGWDETPVPGAAFSRHALRQLATEYYKSIQRDRDKWTSFADIEPQIHEFELRCEMQDFEEAAYVLSGFAHTALWWGNAAQILPMVDSVRRNLHDSALRQSMLRTAASAASLQGRYDEAFTYLDEARDIVRADGLLLEESAVCFDLAWTAALSGRLSVAQAWAQESFQLARERTLEIEEANASRLLCWYAITQDRPDEAEDHAEHALAIARRVGNVRGECLAFGELARVRLEQARFTEAEDHARRGLEFARATVDRREEQMCLNALARSLSGQREHAEAVRLATEAVAVARQLGDPRQEANSLRVLASSTLAADDAAAAVLSAANALELDTRIGNVFGEAQDRSLLGRCLLGCGRAAEARAELKRSLALARATGARRVEREAQAELEGL